MRLPRWARYMVWLGSVYAGGLALMLVCAVIGQSTARIAIGGLVGALVMAAVMWCSGAGGWNTPRED